MIAIMLEQLSELFDNAAERQYPRGSHVFSRGAEVSHMYLVRVGHVCLTRVLPDGTKLILHRASEGSLVADASLFADVYHCDAICETDVRAAFLPCKLLTAALCQNDLVLPCLQNVAKEVQALRTRIEVMRLRRLRDRLIAYLDLFDPPETGKWVEVADWIGVTPAALYRELARMRRREERPKPSPASVGDRPIRH
ncbi:MAG: Crp/Fnr family transcriptional regulator [Devosia sp.]